MQVPLLDLKAQYAPLRAAMEASLREVVESQHFILGPVVAGFGWPSANTAAPLSPLACPAERTRNSPSSCISASGPATRSSPRRSLFSRPPAASRGSARAPFSCDIEPATFNLPPAAVASYLANVARYARCRGRPAHAHRRADPGHRTGAPLRTVRGDGRIHRAGPDLWNSDSGGRVAGDWRRVSMCGRLGLRRRIDGRIRLVLILSIRAILERLETPAWRLGRDVVPPTMRRCAQCAAHGMDRQYFHHVVGETSGSMRCRQRP